MRAVILAGGLGTRLNKIIKNLPKPMIKIGNSPILAHQIELFKKYGIKDITFTTCYLPEVIEKYFKNGQNFGVGISYLKEEKPLGTAGGLKEIEAILKNDFLLLYGDVMMNLDVAKLIKFHKEKRGVATLVLHPNNHPQDSDLVEINENQKIIALHPKPHPKGEYFHNLVNAGLYVLSPKILKYINKGVKADFGKDIFPKIVKKEKFYGYVTAEYLKDMGTPARLSEVQKDYKSGKIARINKENKRAAIFLDRDGVINDASSDVCKIKDFKLFPWAGKAIKKINNSEFLAIVITNQPAVAKSACSIKELDNIHKKMGTLLGKEEAKLDAIYYCPHHPDYDIKCNCRKPKIGLIKRAEKKFNIDLKNSYFIGDSWRDILCGKKAGLISIGVKTGNGCRGIKEKPDFLFDNLEQAVNFILKPKRFIRRLCFPRPRTNPVQ